MNQGGRPTVMTEETIAKLEEAFSWGCTDTEACLWAGIDNSTLYRYQVANPKYCNRKEALKKSPTLKARRNVNRSLDAGDDKMAQWYLENKESREFSKTERKEITGENGGPILIDIFDGKTFVDEPETNDIKAEGTHPGPEDKEV